MKFIRSFLLRLIAALLLPLSTSSAQANVEYQAKLVAITFDDLPFANASKQTQVDAAHANAAIRRTLVHWRVPATGFVTEKSVQALAEVGAPLLRAWLEAGFDLGNHGATHADSNILDIDGVSREIVEGEATIAPLAKAYGRPLTFYRFAYNHVGDTDQKRSAIEHLLAEHGYRLAASTIDTSDYMFDQAYTRAANDHAMRRRIERAYLDYSRNQIRYYQALNKQVLGREPPAILLLHLNRLNAAALNQLLSIFRSEGFQFVSLSDAQADDAYRISPTITTRFGPMWGYRWARERAVRIDGSKESEPPEWLQKFAETGVATGGL
ncbi:MAG: polysaccharide deacetylase family protein [Novosphingobium sp.]